MDRDFFPAIGAIGLLLLTACGGGAGSGAGNSVGTGSVAQTLTIASAAPPSGMVGTPYDGSVGPTCTPGSPNCVCIYGGTRDRCNIAEHGYQLAVTGGTTPYSFKWAAAAGSGVPPSLTLSATGVIDAPTTTCG